MPTGLRLRAAGPASAIRVQVNSYTPGLQFAERHGGAGEELRRRLVAYVLTWNSVPALWPELA